MSTRPSQRPTLAERQTAFAAHLRDPERHPPPGDVEPRRIAIHRELVFGNVANLLASNFPVLHSILPVDRWRALVRDFLASHDSGTPLFHRIAMEFLAYLAREPEPLRDGPGFLAELAHYEWIETELALSGEEPEHSRIDPRGDLLSRPPVLSPLARRLRYAYPVHRIAPDHQPTTPSVHPTHLVVVRDAGDEVRFLEVTPATAGLLERIERHPGRTGREHLERVAAELGGARRKSLLADGARILESLRERDVILGTRLPAESETPVRRARQRRR